MCLRLSCIFHSVVVFLQQTVKTFLVLAQRFRLPVFLADTAVLKLLSHDAVRQRDWLVHEPHCTFLCTGRPVVSFALFASAWKSDVSVRSTSTVENYLTQIVSWFSTICVKFWNFYFCGQPGFLSAVEHKGFELFELRGDDPRLSSLDTLSGEQIPLHFLFRLHGYVIQVGGIKVMWHFTCVLVWQSQSITEVFCPGGISVRAQWELPVARTVTL